MLKRLKNWLTKKVEDDITSNLKEYATDLEREIGHLFRLVQKDGDDYSCFEIVAGPYASIIFSIDQCKIEETEDGLKIKVEPTIHQHNIEGVPPSRQGFIELVGKIVLYSSLKKLTRNRA